MRKKNMPFPEMEAFHYEPSEQSTCEGKKRAAAYCRVSTLSEEQELSFSGQVSYYTELIGRYPTLTLVWIYADQGFSCLDMSHRKEFQRMLADCEAGLIDINLNQQMKMTFYDYINSLRIERAAIPLMREHPEYKYEYVASESGFASISTFRRAFVKVTGQTPSQYAAALSAQK